MNDRAARRPPQTDGRDERMRGREATIRKPRPPGAQQGMRDVK